MTVYSCLGVIQDYRLKEVSILSNRASSVMGLRICVIDSQEQTWALSHLYNPVFTLALFTTE